MFTKLLQPFFSKIFIGIDIDEENCQVNILRVKNKKIQQNIKTDFKIIDNLLPLDALKLINFYRKKYPFTYIGFFSKSTHQGAIPTTKLEEYIHFGLSSKGIKTITFQHWSAYIKKQNLPQELNQAKNLGAVDYLFSPFIPISFLAQKENRCTTLYILQYRQSVAICIAQKELIAYGGMFEILADFSEDSLSVQQPTQSSDALTFEDILSSLDEDFEDLDDIDDLENNEDLLNNTQENNDKIDELKDFMRATTIANITENVIQEYYNNKHYKGAFIDQVIILDTYGIAPDAINHLKETLMIDCIIKPFSPAQEITSLMLQDFFKGTL